MERDHFELRRRVDGLVYEFQRTKRPEGSIAYKRLDMDVWIVYDDDYGWIAYDEETKAVTGRPWTVLLRNQIKDNPPEDAWVSMKGVKSYVYDLKYIIK